EAIKPVENTMPLVPSDLGWTNESDEQLLRARNQQMRDSEGVTEDMKNEVMDLLRLFGVPFIVAPMEAEAQCATLEQLGLVNGVITDDSDIFAFGGKKVYKNMFKTTKFVEAFYMNDIGRELGLDQESMIALALLLGSDYTDGIHGVGIVNATEIVHAFPGIDGLHQFKAWVNEFDLAAQLKPQAKLSESDLAEMDPLERFKHTHHKVRRNWTIGDAFPNFHVVKAYLEPETDRSDARFSWATPDLANLRVFCGRAFGWPLEKVNTTLLPIVQAATRGWFETQTRIDSYFTSYKDDVKYAKIRSKRLQAVVESINTPKKKKPRRKANN
ncbi:DNA repair protein, partial [Thraustotheca clavata]